MMKRSHLLVGVLSLALILAAAASAAAPVPKDGRYAGAFKGQPGPADEYFTISRSGRAVSLDLELPLICETGIGAFHSGAAITLANLSAAGKESPLKIAAGKFSYSGPVYGSLTVTGKAKISGTFKSPTKLVATVQVTWPPSELGPGYDGPCETDKLTVTASRE